MELLGVFLVQGCKESVPVDDGDPVDNVLYGGDSGGARNAVLILHFRGVARGKIGNGLLEDDGLVRLLVLEDWRVPEGFLLLLDEVGRNELGGGLLLDDRLGLGVRDFGRVRKIDSVGLEDGSDLLEIEGSALMNRKRGVLSDGLELLDKVEGDCLRLVLGGSLGVGGLVLLDRGVGEDLVIGGLGGSPGLGVGRSVEEAEGGEGSAGTGLNALLVEALLGSRSLFHCQLWLQGGTIVS